MSVPLRRPSSQPPTSADVRPRLGLPLAFIAVAVGVTASLVVFVRVKSAQIEVGYRIHDLRQELVSLEQQHSALEVERTALLRPSRLAHLARTELGLVPADVSNSVSSTPQPSAGDHLAPQQEDVGDVVGAPL